MAGAPPAGVAPLQTARGRVLIHVDQGWITTDAELTLHNSGTPVAQWIVDVPAGTVLKPADPSRVQVSRADDAGGLHYTVHRNEPSDDDLMLTATLRHTADGRETNGGRPLPCSWGQPAIRRGSRQQFGAGGSLDPSSAGRTDSREITGDERRADPESDSRI